VSALERHLLALGALQPAARRSHRPLMFTPRDRDGGDPALRLKLILLVAGS